MSFKLHIGRKDLTAMKRGTGNTINIAGALLRIFHTADDGAQPPQSMAEYPMRDGEIYQIYTGIQVTGLEDSSTIIVRALPDIWRQYGLQVMHHALEEGNELVVYVRVCRELAFHAGTYLFSMAFMADFMSTLRPSQEDAAKPAPALTTPGIKYGENTQHIPNSEPVAPQAAGRQQRVDPTAAAQAWLNSEDDYHGHEVETPSDPGMSRHRPPVRASVVTMPDAPAEQRINTQGMESYDPAMLQGDEVERMFAAHESAMDAPPDAMLQAQAPAAPRAPLPAPAAPPAPPAQPPAPLNPAPQGTLADVLGVPPS